MKNKKYIVGATAGVVAALIGVLVYVFTGVPTYLRVLPADSKALAYLDVKQLLHSGHANTEDLVKLIPSDMNIEKTGLDLSERAYAFVSKNESMGLIACVEDADELKKLFTALKEKEICGEIEEFQGYNWVVIDHNIQAAFNDEVLLVMGPATMDAQGELRREMLGYLKQSESESAIEGQLFKKLQGQKAAISFACMMDVIPQNQREQSAAMMPQNINMEEIGVMISLKADKKKIALRSEIFSENENFEKYIQEWTKAYKPIEGNLLNMIPSRMLMWMGANVNGEQLILQMRKNPTLRTYLAGLNLGIDADMVIKSMDGDISLAVPGLTNSFEMPLLLTAEIKNSDFIKDVDYWKESIEKNHYLSLDNYGKDQYRFSTGNQHFYFGVKNELLYACVTEDMARQACEKQHNELINEYQKTIKGSLFFMILNMEEVINNTEVYANIFGFRGMEGPVKHILGLFHAVVLKVADPKIMELEIYTKDEVNILKTIINE